MSFSTVFAVRISLVRAQHSQAANAFFVVFPLPASHALELAVVPAQQVPPPQALQAAESQQIAAAPQEDKEGVPEVRAAYGLQSFAAETSFS